MTEYNLHTLVLVGDTQQNAQSAKQRQTAIAAILGPGAASTESIGAEPGEQSFRGAYRGADSEVMMTELVEITDNGAPDFDAVAMYGANETTGDDAYYSLSDVRPERPRTTTRNFWTYTLSLRKKGTPKTHKRAVATTVTAYDTSPDENPFFAADEIQIAAPSNATNPRWFDATNKSYENATPTSSDVATQFADVDLYNVSAPTFSDPTLVYDLDYDEEGKVDTRVWDDRGNANRVNNSVLQWARVFDPGHEFTGDAIVDNGRIRLTFNESETLSAERWNETAGSYDAVALNDTDWDVEDLDLEQVGLARTTGQVVFQNRSDSVRYHVAVDVKRGLDDAVWTVPANEGLAFDIHGAVLSDSIDTQGNGPQGMAWGANGTKLHEVGLTDDKVYEYDVGTAFDVSTASVARNISAQDAQPHDIDWNNDGTKLYEVGQDNASIYESELTDAYNVSTATFARNITTQDATPTAMAWNDDGSKLYEAGEDNSSIYEYDVSEAFNVSTATFARNITSQDAAPQGIAWNNDGTKLFEIAVGPTDLHEYDVSEAFNVSTASASTSIDIDDNFPNDVEWDANGTKLYAVGSGSNKIYEFDAHVPANLTHHLTDVASGMASDPGGVKTLVRREDTRL